MISKYKGKLEGFPKEVVERMLYEQEKQGNKRDVTVFERDSDESRVFGGFNKSDTINGYSFWCDIINKKDFDLFFKKYPKKEETFEVGDWVTITKSPNNWNPKMDKFDGKTVQIIHTADNLIQFEGCEEWSWGYENGHFRRATPEEIPTHIDELPKEWCFKITKENYEKFKHLRVVPEPLEGYITSRSRWQGGIKLGWGEWFQNAKGTEIPFELFAKHYLTEPIKEFPETGACEINDYLIAYLNDTDRILSYDSNKKSSKYVVWTNEKYWYVKHDTSYHIYNIDNLLNIIKNYYQQLAYDDMHVPIFESNTVISKDKFQKIEIVFKQKKTKRKPKEYTYPKIRNTKINLI